MTDGCWNFIMNTGMHLRRNWCMKCLQIKKMWDQDLTGIEGLEKAVTEDLEKIRREGAKAAYAGCL